MYLLALLLCSTLISGADLHKLLANTLQATSNPERKFVKGIEYSDHFCDNTSSSISSPPARLGWDKVVANVYVFDGKVYYYRVPDLTSTQLTNNYCFQFLHATGDKKQHQLISYFDKVKRPYRQLFALSDRFALYFSQYYPVLGPEFATTCPEPMMKILTNKALFHAFVRSVGLGQYLPEIYATADDVVFPAVIKHLDQTAGVGVEIVNTRLELDALILKNRQKSIQFLLQECIVNDEQLTIHFSAIQGRMIKMICIPRKLPSDLSQNRPKTYSFMPEARPNKECFAPMIRSLLRATNYTGIGGLDLKVQPRTGLPKVFDFNSRITGTLRWGPKYLSQFLCSMQGNGRARLIRGEGCVFYRRKSLPPSMFGREETAASTSDLTGLT